MSGRDQTGVRLWLTPFAMQDVAYWQANDPVVARRIEQLFNQLKNDAPESSHRLTCLALEYPHLLSVKITAEHRMVFERLGDGTIVHQCRYHY